MIDVLDTGSLVRDALPADRHLETIGLGTSVDGTRILVSRDGGYRRLLCAPSAELFLRAVGDEDADLGGAVCTRADLEALPAARTQTLVSFLEIKPNSGGLLDVHATLWSVATAFGVQDPPEIPECH